MRVVVAAVVMVVGASFAEDAHACVCRDISPHAPRGGDADVPLDAKVWLPLRVCDAPTVAVFDVVAETQVPGTFTRFGHDATCLFEPTQAFSPDTHYAVYEFRLEPSLMPFAEQIAEGRFFPRLEFTTGSAETSTAPSVPPVAFREVSAHEPRGGCDQREYMLEAIVDVESDAPVLVADIDGAGLDSPFQEGAAFFATADNAMVITNRECGLPWDVPFGTSVFFRFGAINASGVFSGWSAPIAIDLPPAQPPDAPEGDPDDVDDDPAISDDGSCQNAPPAPLGGLVGFLLTTRRHRRRRT
jgi:hypothetical protein